MLKYASKSPHSSDTNIISKLITQIKQLLVSQVGKVND